MPVDPFGYDIPPPIEDSYFPLPPSPYEDPWYVDIFSQGIEAARDVARGALSDYAYPDDPRYRPNVTVYPPSPQPGPQPSSQPTPQPGVQPTQPSGGVQLSNMTLMLLVGGVLLFMLGKRGK